MSLGLRPKARRSARSAVITGKLANSPAGSGGEPLRGAGYGSFLRSLLSRVSGRRSRDEDRITARETRRGRPAPLARFR